MIRLRQRTPYCSTVAFAMLDNIMNDSDELENHLKFDEWELAEDDVAHIQKNLANILEAIQVCEKAKEPLSELDREVLGYQEELRRQRSNYPVSRMPYRLTR